MANIKCIKTITTPIWMLRKTSFWPEQTYTKTFILTSIFNNIFHFTIYTLLILDIINALKSNDIKLFNWVIGILIPITNYYAKAVTIIYNKKCLFSILDDFKSNIFNSHTEKHNLHIQLIRKVSHLIMRYLIITMGIFVLIFSVPSFFTNGLLFIPPPFEIENFDVLYKFVNLIAACYIGYNCGGLDVLFLTFLALCVAQLQILKERLKNILEDAKKINVESKYKMDLDIILADILRECVLLHKKINRFVEKLGVLLSLPLFVQYVSGCVMICFSIIQLTLGSKRSALDIIGLCGYSSATFGQMSAYHYLGNEIIYQSNEIVESCYLSRWYELNPKFQKRILLLMERATRPLILSAYKFVFISLASLGVIVQWSYSLYAVTKAKYG